ncbi:PRC-barrel domain-containing protein [Actinoplanes sp. NPDC051411]|uniref:PRC-barrel domain-containing protein n=1 Tax=Actinoplanes sp. NPDC051411 TaxID=3155522 RepID=UPI00341AAF1C
MTDAQDLGEPVSYLVLKDGTPVFDSSGDRVGEVEHVLADEQEDVFHGLIVKTADGHRFAAAEHVDGLFERGVIINTPAGQLPEPSASSDSSLGETLKRAWDWLIQPK